MHSTRLFSHLRMRVLRRILQGDGSQNGFTLIELLVGVALFALVAVGVYSSVTYILQSVYLSRVQFSEVEVANEQLELARNLPYDQVGVVGGIPSGVLPATSTAVKSGTRFLVQNFVRSIDDPFDGTLGGTPNDTSPADYKKVQVEVTCLNCVLAPKHPIVLSTNIAPKALEDASANGALFITVFDASGNSIPGASVHITNPTVNPPVDYTDATDVNGKLQIVDMVPAVSSYHIVVTKDGYSTDYTVTPGGAITNPVKPDATVASQTVTNISFSIDKVGSIPLATIGATCAAIPNVGFTVQGTKLLGQNPDVLKYNQSVSTDVSGAATLSNLEWDTYQFALSGAAYDIAGTIPVLPITLAPGSTENLKVALAAHTANNLLITVKDSGTKLPISGATVTITNGSASQLVTGYGYIRQTDWSGGAGQANFVDATKYFWQDGSIDDTGTPGDLFLQKSGNSYAWSGQLISSTIDFGAPSNFTNLQWLPLAQNSKTGADSLKFQIATSAASNPNSWNYLGPDGAAGTYYTVSNANINAAHNGDRYLRYKVFMSTADNKYSPQLSELAFSFTSGCTPPGQAFFSNLSSGTYTVTVTAPGYQDLNTQADVNGTSAAELFMTP